MSATGTGPRARRWLREPVLHFAVIGILLFVGHGLVGEGRKADDRIVVTRATVDDIVRQHQARWNRPPGEQELTNLVEAHVRDEILYREGQALGLDRDDPVIKRRVRQKFEILAEEQLPGTAATDAELSTYLAQNSPRFMRPATVSFEQIFFDGSGSAARVERAVAAAKAGLARGADPATLGQRTMLPPGGDNVPIDIVARDFGAEFAGALAKVPLGEWIGPVSSGMGAHLVRVSARTPAALPPLDDVRQQVAREWENQRRERSREESYRRLRSGYTVVIDGIPRPALTAPP